jgi:hypothetical protein
MWFTEGLVDKIGRIVSHDTTPPLITVLAAPIMLWPPNGKMMPVRVSGKVIDLGSGLLAPSLEYAVTDEYHLVQPKGHITLDAAGNYVFQVLLHASRQGDDLNGRSVRD